jgi:YesN/AraC family two-component response regulator
MNGIELVLTLMADSPKLKVLLTSGFFDPANANGVMRDAKLPILHKPYRKAELAAQLNQLIP